jgi:phospholipid/cholesterol/gamma-HCH transport system substrate-binding protein
MKRSTFITWDQLKVGAVILIALAILTVAIFQLGQAANLFTSRYTLVALLKTASGLRVGGSVTVAGQLAGTVEKIEFLDVDADTVYNLKVTFQLDERLQEQVREDSRGQLRTLGLLGDKTLDISTGTPQFSPLQEGDTVITLPSQDYEAVIAQAASAVDDMVALTTDLRQITGGIVRGEGTLGQFVTNRSLYNQLEITLSTSNRLLVRLQNPNGTFGKMLDDPTLHDQLVGMVASMDSLVTKLNAPTGTLGKMMSDTTLYANIVGMSRSADSLMKMLSGGQGTAGKLLADQALYDQILKTVTDLNALLADIRANPRKYFKIF